MSLFNSTVKAMASRECMLRARAITCQCMIEFWRAKRDRYQAAIKALEARRLAMEMQHKLDSGEVIKCRRGESGKYGIIEKPSITESFRAMSPAQQEKAKAELLALMEEFETQMVVKES